MKRLIKWLLLILFLAALLVSGFIVWDLWRHDSFAERTFETTAPLLPPTELATRILVFSKTNHYRHASIPAANQALDDIAKQHDWATFFTENAAIHNPAQLAEFDLIIWNNNTGDVLLPKQQQALRSWLENGGRWLGLHGTGGNLSYAWPWRADSLIKARFSGHTLLPQLREADLIIEAPTHPVTAGLPNPWRWRDEWYSFSNNPRANGANILIRVDEHSYQPAGPLQMGRDHPLVWTHTIGQGQALYSALGHTAESWTDPVHRRLLSNILLWLVGQENAGGAD